ncbi:MAG: hypothetical protein JWP40_4023, partial [Blastococcus sp.]|nr:hypothetical protein [Blastococcus sp.]
VTGPASPQRVVAEGARHDGQGTTSAGAPRVCLRTSSHDSRAAEIRPARLLTAGTAAAPVELLRQLDLTAEDQTIP